MPEKLFVSGDEAVALGVRLARPHVISAYPITPQTIVVEKLSDYVEDGSLKSIYLHVESEHSAMAAAMGVSAVGARAFTATSSQGLLYMCEGLHYASGARFPIVMMNANRSVAAPWSILGEHKDSLSQLDSGWIQIYVEDSQEALDMIIQSYKLAEHPDVLLPVMVNLDGFLLTHTYEVIECPDQQAVDAFLPPFETVNKMSLEAPKNLCMTAGPAFNTEIRYRQHQSMMKALDIAEAIDRDFGAQFGRYYDGMIEPYHCEDADTIVIAIGSIAGTVRLAVDSMRAKGIKAGMLKLRFMRPFPADELRTLTAGAKAVGVIDKDLSYGYEGTVFTNVSAALKHMSAAPAMLNFIAGLGGRDIDVSDVMAMFDQLAAVLDNPTANHVRFINLGGNVNE
jgi:pyruvate ferredoxin oxidoreductase alpha subunit